MRIRIFALLSLTLTGLFCEAKPRLIHSEESVTRAGVQYKKITNHFFFHQSELHYHYLLDAKKQLTKQKWGDFELGLWHGRIQNGSWCVWNFFYCLTAGKNDLVRERPAEKVCLIPTAGGLHAEIVWPELTLKLIQRENAKEWIFMEVTVKTPPAALQLRAWPGGAKCKLRGVDFRHLMIGDQDLTIPTKKLEYSAPAGGLALCNRHYSERNGNFLVFEPEKYLRTTASASNQVILEFTPKPGEKVFHFALGYFLDEEPQESCGRFLKERLPNIAALLKQMQWSPEADYTAFSRNITVIQKMLEQSELPEKQRRTFETEVRQCQERFRQAEKNRDIPAACQEIECSGVLRTQIGQEAVKTFR